MGAGLGVESSTRAGPWQGAGTQPLSLSQVHMDILTKQRRVWKEEFWQNPWDQGGLAAISVFIVMILILMMFAIVFGALLPLEKVDQFDES